MRTYVYVDGFNLFHGALQGTDYRWLDLLSLFRGMLEPDYKVNKVKYFTARIKKGENAEYYSEDQSIYLQALSKYCCNLEIIYGKFVTNVVKRPIANSKSGELPNIDVIDSGGNVVNRKIAKSEEKENELPRIKVLNREEKGSDVNLAVHLLDDAWKNSYDLGVVVTNDSDFAMAMELAGKVPNKSIGLLRPRTEQKSAELAQYASFSRPITVNALEANQLPSPIPGTKITKPSTW